MLDNKAKKIYNNLASYRCAGLAERSKAAVLKTVVPLRVPGVRIPKPAPLEIVRTYGSYFFICGNVWF